MSIITLKSNSNYPDIESKFIIDIFIITLKRSLPNKYLHRKNKHDNQYLSREQNSLNKPISNYYCLAIVGVALDLISSSVCRCFAVVPFCYQWNYRNVDGNVMWLLNIFGDLSFIFAKNASVTYEHRG